MSRSAEPAASRIHHWHGMPCPWLTRLLGVVIVVAFVGLGETLARLIPAHEPHELAVELRDPRSGATIAMSVRRAHANRRCDARAIVSFRPMKVDFSASVIMVAGRPSWSIPNSDHVLVVDGQGLLDEARRRVSTNLCQELVRILLSRDSSLDLDAVARLLSPPSGDLKDLLVR